MIYKKGEEKSEKRRFTENEARKNGTFVENGYEIMKLFLEK